MKKIELKKMEVISGGMKCGWVGILAVVVYATPIGGGLGHLTGLNDAIADCWG